MAATNIVIANIALRKIGARTITAIPGTTEEGAVIDSIYSEILDEVLSEHLWTFAQKRAELIDITKPSTNASAWVTGTAYVAGDQVLSSSVNYTCISAHTSGTFATDLAAAKWIACEEIVMDDDGMDIVYYKPSDMVKLNFQSEPNALLKIESQGILSDTAGMKVIYTYRNTTTTTYPSQFTMALATRLASEICFNITNYSSMAANLFEEYEKIRLPRAQALDSQQGTPLGIQQDLWEDARRSIGDPLSSSSSFDGWFPVT